MNVLFGQRERERERERERRREREEERERCSKFIMNSINHFIRELEKRGRENRKIFCTSQLSAQKGICHLTMHFQILIFLTENPQLKNLKDLSHEFEFKTLLVKIS